MEGREGSSWRFSLSSLNYMDIKRRDQIKKGKKDSVKESVKKRNQRKLHIEF